MSVEEAKLRPRHSGYPEAKRGLVSPWPDIIEGYKLNAIRPDVPYSNEQHNNPALRGFALIVAAFLYVVQSTDGLILQLRD